jgi:outer membrane protein assembly factor BamB
MRLAGWLVGASVVVAALAAPSRAENWPQWRGPFFNGSTTEKNLPVTCGPETQVWAADLPGHASATPIVWGDRVFVSSTDPENKGLLGMCLSAADGKTLWKKRLGADITAPRNDGASPSPCTDGKGVYFLYGSGDLAALDFGGNVLWSRNLVKDFGSLSIKYGYSSSPLLWKGRLYVLLLRRPKPYGRAPESDKPLDSLLLAVDPATGRNLWKHVRETDAREESSESYGTPIPYEGKGRTEILIEGGDYLSAHDPATGREFWRYGYNPSRSPIWRLIPSPAAWGHLVFGVVPRGGPLFAVKAGGLGRLGAGAVAWTVDGRTTDSGTPLVYENSLYILQSDKSDPVIKGSPVSPGIFLLCVDLATGKMRGQARLAGGGAWRASPTGADGKVYCLSEEGEVVVVEAGGEFKILSRTNLGDGPTQSTLAAAGGRLYVRTATKLHCFGDKSK